MGNEARQLAQQHFDRLDAMTLTELGKYVGDPVDKVVESKAGTPYRLQIDSFTPAAEKDAHVHVRLRVSGLGWRRFERYTGGVMRGNPEKLEDMEVGEPAYEEPGVQSRWQTWRDGCLIFAIVTLALVPWIAGAVYLVSLFI